MKRYALFWLIVHCITSFQLRCKSTVLLSRHYLSPALEDAIIQQETIAHSKLIGKEINRRRNFAIISHPDAGKTTLTEKLLLFGGAIQDAGAVKAKADQRKATSDWMEIEKQRGISVTSTVLSFEFSPDGGQNKYQLNLLDTPGHQDFSEDTYRTLAAADNCVMLIDAAKGIEDRTRKLYDVCKMRKLPIFSFANKLDRPSLSPFDVVDQIEKEFGLECCPINWPIGDGEDFQGVYDRQSKEVHLFQRGHRRKKVEANVVLLGDPLLQEIIGTGLYNQLMEDIDVLDSLVPEPDLQKIQAGQQTPLFFGSAMTNFGVEIFLKNFLHLARSPTARTALVEETVLSVQQVGVDAAPVIASLSHLLLDAAVDEPPSETLDVSDDTGDEAEHSPVAENAVGPTMPPEVLRAPSPSTNSKTSHTNSRRTEERLVSPEEPEFSGFVFKLQANLDPKHRDRMAFIRICSGVFRKGMKVQHSRMRRSINLSSAQSLFAQEREAVVEAYPGDVIGIHNPGIFAIGDTIYTGSARITYPGIPSFSPEKFAYLRNPNPSAYKKFQKGLSELLDEGAVQMLRDRGDDGNGAPLLAAVGQLQFEVVAYRLKGEYGVDSRMDPLDYTMARWVNGGWDAVEAAESAGKLHGVYVCKDRWDRPVLLFRNPWKVQQLVSEVEYLKLEPWAMPPTEFS